MSPEPPSPAPRVCSLAPLDRRGRRIRVGMDDDSTLELALEVIERAGLGMGDPLDAELRAELADADLRWRAREVALGFLAHRVRSRGETRRRLRAAAFPTSVVEACLDKLAQDGLLDDGAFAAAFVRDRINIKPRGPARLRHELRGKGVDAGVADRAIQRGLEGAGHTDRSLAVSVALRWLGGAGARERPALASTEYGGEREAALRRLVGFLKRRGFGGDAVSAAVAAVQEEARRADG